MNTDISNPRMKPIYDNRKDFEAALERAWKEYNEDERLVDGFEDNYTECAHAKGFRDGFLFALEFIGERNS